MKKTILLNRIPVEYDLQVKNVKRINLRVHRDGGVCVSANRYVSQQQVDFFLRQNTDFILQTMENFRKMREAGDGMSVGKNREYQEGDLIFLKGEAYRLQIVSGKKETVELLDKVLMLTQKDKEDAARRTRMMERFLKEYCRQEIMRVCREAYPAFEKLGVEWPEIRVRSMVSRWGSCQPSRGVLTFARQLIEVPEQCMEYVVVHEFAHFIHPDHSPEFHEFLTGVMPDWKTRRNQLNSRSWVIAK